MPESNKFILFSIFNGIAVIACAVFLITALNNTSSADTNAGTCLPVSKGGTSCDYKNFILASGIYPVGSIYISTTNTNPGDYLGGTWEAFGTGKTLVGVDTGDSDFNTVEKSGGAKTHTHPISINSGFIWDNTNRRWIIRVAQISTAYNTGSNQYFQNPGLTDAMWSSNATGTTAQNSIAVGTSGSGSSLQPYVTAYFWKRTN